jgi:glycosyltransferase involved in cell wall biosynthesis
VKHDALRVSVAMCTFNGEAFVKEQLESILAQSRLPDEIVICDDGSTDGTIGIVKQFADKHPAKFRIVQNQQKLGSCRNFELATSLVTGDVIFFSDYDDVWFPEKVATMLDAFATDSEVVMAYSDAVITDCDLRPTGTVFERRKGTELRQSPTLQDLGRGVGFNGPMIAFRSCLKPFVIPFSPLSLQWTHDHWVGFIAYAVGKIAVIDRPLVYYRRHEKNEGGDAEFDGGIWHQLQVVRKLHNNLKRYGERRRGWEDMVARLREIKNRGLTLRDPAKLDELLQLSELCLQFATTRQMQEAKGRLARTPGALRLLLGGDYHRYARGVKSFVQDFLVS